MEKRDIPQGHNELLRQMCAVPNGQELPEKVVSKYWLNQNCACRIGYGLTMGDLVRIGVECGYGKPTEREANPTIIDLWRLKKAKAGDPVLVNWRGKKSKGTLLNINATNQIRVLLDNDPEEKQVEVGQVTLATAA